MSIYKIASNGLQKGGKSKNALFFQKNAISVQRGNGVDKKYAAAAREICSNQDSKIYAVVKAEISEVMKLSNEYFDIRHNEYLNKAKEKREALEDLQFIEYLYNRVYALLYLLRLKVNKVDLISGNAGEQKNFEKSKNFS